MKFNTHKEALYREMKGAYQDVERWKGMLFSWKTGRFQNAWDYLNKKAFPAHTAGKA